MDVALLIITFASLSVALVSIVSLRKMKRDERQRSDARIAALSAADAPPIDESAWEHDAAAPNAAGAERLFDTVQRTDVSLGGFAIAIAVLLAAVAIGGVTASFMASGDKPLAAAAVVDRVEPLELMSLAHSQANGALVITGVVRNPSSRKAVEGLTAVVSFVDGRGGLIATRDVPLDYRTLRGGEATSFNVKVPGAPSVARYRVSFRAGTDVVPHLDRRSDKGLAGAL